MFTNGLAGSLEACSAVTFKFPVSLPVSLDAKASSCRKVDLFGAPIANVWVAATAVSKTEAPLPDPPVLEQDDVSDVNVGEEDDENPDDDDDDMKVDV